MPRETIARLKEQIELQRIEIEFLKSAGEDGIKMKDAEIQQLESELAMRDTQSDESNKVIVNLYAAIRDYG